MTRPLSGTPPRPAGPTPPEDDEAAQHAASAVFGPRLDLATRYVALLAGTGVAHGLIGPREAPRLWTRHVLNCAVVQAGIDADVQIADVGSGAGLPGIPLAIARPDIRVHLLEPLLRRASWLSSAVSDLGLDNVVVHRGRAQDLAGELLLPVVTARAVARLGVLAQWCLPLVQPGGSLLALKGMTAATELERERADLARLGVRSTSVETYGLRLVTPATTVVRVVADGPAGRPGRTGVVSRRRPPQARGRTP